MPASNVRQSRSVSVDQAADGVLDAGQIVKSQAWQITGLRIVGDGRGRIGR
jgi:hypothetical protein